jgi:CheY-like chemotaxis protein
MRKKLNCVLLIDDSRPGNRYHEIILNELNVTENVHVAENGLQALEYFKNDTQNPPELVFLDINMPLMDGWQFLEAYKKIDDTRKAKTIVMLSTSEHPKDMERAKQIPFLADYKVKSLTEEMVYEILDTHFASGN